MFAPTSKTMLPVDTNRRTSADASRRIRDL